MTDNKFVLGVAKSASETPQFAGFPWAILFEIAMTVGQYLIKCYQEKHTDTPAQVVGAQYDAGEYHPRFLAAMTRRTHAAARAKGQKLSRDQARVLAVHALDAIRTGETDELKAMVKLDD